MEAVGVPCGPVNNLEGVYNEPHMKARGAAMDIPCKRALGGSVKLLETPSPVPVPPRPWPNS
ncbi:CoA transferase [Pandoraea communis]|uniref:CoA transferase n=1 Tax=Pandoraea communis TaxID=2508297 RepID=UPI001FE2DD95|nr:CoA transferase [Pandoraea communis]